MPRSIPRSDPEYQGPAVLSEQGQCYWIVDASSSNRPIVGTAAVLPAIARCHPPEGADAEPGW